MNNDNDDGTNHRFDYHRPKDQETISAHEQIRESCRLLAFQLKALVPEGREQSIAITKIEEAMMWANAGIARNGGAT